MTEAVAVDDVVAEVLAAGEALRAAPVVRVIAMIASAAERIADPSRPLGAEARRVLPARSGLSPAGVEEALDGTLGALTHATLVDAAAALERARQDRHAVPATLAAMILASNVFTAALRPLAWSLLARVPAVLRPSERDEGLAELFLAALREADPQLARAVGIVRFARTDRAALARLGSRADVVHAWGSDEAMQQIRAALPGRAAFVGHGHGLGAVVVPASCAMTIDEVAEGIARDVARYDQRGCLSPQLVLVERGGAFSGLALAERLAQALDALGRSLPRGPLPLEVAAAQAQWRGVAMVRGELFEGAESAVAFEGDEPARSTPGYRNVAVHELAGRAEVLAWLRPYGTHLKALGVADDASVRRAIAAQLPPPLAPRVSAVGTMQTPPLTASVDGEPPWVGALRWLDCD